MNASTVEQNLMQKGNGSSTYGINWPGKVPDVMIDFAIRTVDYDLIETLGMQITNGRSFSKAYGAEENGLIFNEHAIKLMGLKNPIGTKVNLWGEDKTIIGVVKDFHISSLHEPIAPLVFRFAPGRTSTFMVKIAPRKERETIAQIQELYNKFNPGYLFEYKFLDEVYQAQYISEQRVSVISKYFAALAGISGMFLSLPVVAVLKVVFDRSNSFKQWGVLFGDERPPKSPFTWPRYRKATKAVQQEIKAANDSKDLK